MSQQVGGPAFQDPAFLQLPALPPPPGVIPNLTDPDDVGPTLIIVGAVLLAVMVLALANRAYTKLCIVQKVSWDDLTISLSAVGAIAWYTICAFRKRANAISFGTYLQAIRLRCSKRRYRETSIRCSDRRSFE